MLLNTKCKIVLDKRLHACDFNIVNANVTNQPCTCELCQPNWQLGVDGDFFQVPPAAPTQQVELEARHWRKLAQARLEPLSAVTG